MPKSKFQVSSSRALLILDSRFPIPDSRFPIPDSRLHSLIPSFPHSLIPSFPSLSHFLCNHSLVRSPPLPCGGGLGRGQQNTRIRVPISLDRSEHTKSMGRSGAEESIASLRWL